MNSRRIFPTIILFISFFALLLVGCSGSGGPGVPDENTYSLTVNIVGEGSVSAGGQSVTDGGELQITEDTILTLNVSPATDWELNDWVGENGDEIVEEGSGYKLTMDGDKEVTAVFVETATIKVVKIGPVAEPASTEVITYSTISEAIGNAVDGDVIEVGEGVYTENLTINTDITDITLRSTFPLDPEVRDATVIDGGSSSEPVVIIESDCHLYGMTVRNGDCADTIFSAGGGISINSEISPVIEYNKITNNSARYGGMYIGGENTAIIANNTITNNHASFNGGGVYVSSSSPEIYGNTISGNEADGDGGGIHVDDSSPEIYGNTISGNKAGRNGGGINVRSDFSSFIYNNTITDNEADFDDNDAGKGGGIYIATGSEINDASGDPWDEENAPPADELNNTYSGNTHYDGVDTDSTQDGADVYWEPGASTK